MNESNEDVIQGGLEFTIAGVSNSTSIDIRAPAKTLILEWNSSHNPKLIAENYFRSHTFPRLLRVPIIAIGTTRNLNIGAGVDSMTW